MNIPLHSPLRREGRIWANRWIVIGLLLLGAALRFPGIGRVPPGLYRDEAQHGLDALRVLEGHTPLYFEANNGREPLYIYLVSGAVAVLGRSPIAIRLPAAYVGVLTLAATYSLARTLWSRRAGRWALAILTVTFWHVHLSRVGFRAGLLPLFTALYLTEAVKGIRHGRRVHWLAAGALYGASWYTYMAARFTPVAVATTALYGLLFHRDDARRLWRSGALFAASALLVLAPLGLYTLTNPDVVLARSGQVAIWAEETHGGRFWATLARHTTATVGMFFVRGDRIWRHNLAWRPVWRPALGAAFLIGTGVALARLRRDARMALSLLWTATLALPTLLAEDAPHFLRGVGVLPTVILLPTVGLGWLSSRLSAYDVRFRRARRRGAILGRWIPPLLIGIGLFFTVRDYFGIYAQAPLTYHWLEGGPVELAAKINKLRGAGWDGDRMQQSHDLGADVYLDRQLWQTWSALPFLVPEETIGFTSDAVAPAVDRETAFAVWPYADRDWAQEIRSLLPHPSYMRVERGPQAQGDRDREPYTIAMIIRTEPLPAVPAPIARFENGVTLRAALVEPAENGITHIHLWWQTDEPLATSHTVFAHYLRGGERLDQHDGEPGFGHLPTTFWAPGDLILDIHPLNGVVPVPASDMLRVGLYDSATGDHLAVVTEDGAPYAEAVELPVILGGP